MSFYQIMISEMKRGGQGQNITLRLSSDWSVSLKLCSDWLGELLTNEFQKWRQTDKHTDRQTYFMSPCWTALSQLKSARSCDLKTSVVLSPHDCLGESIWELLIEQKHFWCLFLILPWLDWVCFLLNTRHMLYIKPNHW